MLCCISAVTAIELLYGAYNAPEKFSSEKIRLEKAGIVIEDLDLMIGTTGVAGDLIVVTHNIKHFNRIKGLEYEDWVI